MKRTGIVPTPSAARFPLGYAAFMWASYMNRTRERRIHFSGSDAGREGWISFGDDLDRAYGENIQSYSAPDGPEHNGRRFESAPR
jgi:hypothetical protein